VVLILSTCSLSKSFAHHFSKYPFDAGSLLLTFHLDLGNLLSLVFPRVNSFSLRTQIPGPVVADQVQFLNSDTGLGALL